MHFEIHRKDVTGSTNDDVWELARQGAPEGTVVCARSQRKGRGQWGRVWVSPEGGLYFSLLLRPAIPQLEWPELSPLIARAVCCVMRAESGVEPQADGATGGQAFSGHGAARSAHGETEGAWESDGGDAHASPNASAAAHRTRELAESIRVKHPNDVICDAGKLCGISLEARDGCVVVGIGVNVYHPDRPTVTDGRNEPAYLCDMGGIGVASGAYLDALLDALLDAIGRALEAFLAE